MAAPDEDESPGRALLLAVGAMLGVALLVGVTVGGVVMAAVDVTGVGERGTVAGPAAPQTMVIPKYRPTKSAGDEWKLPSVKPSPSPTLDLGDQPVPPKAGVITLSITPLQVAPGQRINLSGAYAGAEGAVLQVQRKEGAVWADFPVDTAVSGGVFDTWIQTSRSGTQQFRVHDKAANRSSNVVTVVVG